MASIFALFASLASSIPSRVLAALGMGFISFAGYSVVGNLLVDLVVTNYSGIVGNSLSFLSLSGLGTGFGIILGAMVTRFSLMGLTRLGKLT